MFYQVLPRVVWSYECGGGEGFIGLFVVGLEWGKKGGNFRRYSPEGILPKLGLVAFDVEFFADVGAFGPLPKLVFECLLVVGFKESDTAFFDGDATGVEVAAAEGDDIGGEGAEAAEFSLGLLGWHEGMGDSGKAEGEPLYEFVAEVEGGSRAGAIGFVRGGEFEGVLAHLPVAEPVLGPFVEVLLGDGSAAELSGEDAFDLGEGVNPGEELVVRFGIGEAVVEFLANSVGEA